MTPAEDTVCGVAEDLPSTRTVRAAALIAFIEYADSLRMSVEGEFCVGQAELAASQREFDALVAALEPLIENDSAPQDRQRLLPVNMPCRNGRHDLCGGHNTHDPDPISECPCACHYTQPEAHRGA